MNTRQHMVNDTAAMFNHAIHQHVIENEKLHQPVLKQKDVQKIGDFIYARCLEEPDLIPAFEHELSLYGYKFGWLKDDFEPYATFLVFIVTPFGMVDLYSRKEAFEGMSKEIDANLDLIDRHQRAQRSGDIAEMEQVKKEFARRLRRKQFVYFLLSPIQALLLGVRGLLRLIKR